MDIKDKRFIEETFPIREVSAEGAKEKNVRHGHISTLHIWWARRPLSTSRATNFAALIPIPEGEEEKQKMRNFIAELCRWDNSKNEILLNKARKMILDANGGKPPKVLDPFGGGGSIPLEALRLGCETYSNDYNPVAVLIQKCTLEYPQKFGKPIPKSQYLKERPWVKIEKKTQKKAGKQLVLNEEAESYNEEMVNPLLEDVKYWGNWVMNEAKKEIEKFYPNDPDNHVPVGYIWARTIPCQNPTCQAEIPLMRQYWLAKKSNRNVSLRPFAKKGKVEFEIVGDGYKKMPDDFDPEKGTVDRAVTTCPVCGSVIDADTTCSLFQQKKNSERMIAVLLHKEGVMGKKYRLATESDMEIFLKAKTYLEKKRALLMDDWGIDPVPNEDMPPSGTLGFRVQRYGVKTWGELYNARQLTMIISLIEITKKVIKQLATLQIDSGLSTAIASYLAFGVDRLADFGSTLCVLNPTGARGVVHAFGRAAMPFTWDYAESNPFNEDGPSLLTAIRKNEEWINHSTTLSLDNPFPPIITNKSATDLQFPDNFFDSIFTDPPYYDNIPYAHLSDYFFVWLKRSLGEVHPELFSTPLSPKKNEIVAYSHLSGGLEGGKRFFEEMLKKAFQEIYRVLKPNGIATIVYAHKSTSGWETVLNALLDSNLIITSSYPLNTEKEGRLRSTDSAALSSSIYIIARKLERKGTGFYNEVKDELKQYLNIKLDQLWAEGVVGADFFIAAIGSAIVVFGKYEKVMDYEGDIKRADVLLDDVREIVMTYTIGQILHNGFGAQVSELTKFYLVYRFNFGEAKLEFDEANKIARSIGIDLDKEFHKRNSFIKKEKEFVRVLSAGQRNIEELEESSELIDVLHHVLQLWEKGKELEMMQRLSETGYGKNEVFFRVAQAISESLGKTTPDSKEKKLIEQFQRSKDRIMQEMGKTKPKPKTEQQELGF